jgi:hypothetical protein
MHGSESGHTEGGTRPRLPERARCKPCPTPMRVDPLLQVPAPSETRQPPPNIPVRIPHPVVGGVTTVTYRNGQRLELIRIGLGRT